MTYEPSWILFQSANSIRAATVLNGACNWLDVEFAIDSPDAEARTTFVSALEKSGYQGQGTTLLLSSEQCLAATFPAHTRGAAGRGEALSFALEEHVPLAAEEMVADFLHAGPHVVGVGVDRNRIFELVERLQQAGVMIESITPAALLAHAQLPTSGHSEHAYLIVWQNQDTIDLLLVASRHVTRWNTLPAEADCLAIELRQLEHENKLPKLVLACDLNDVLVQSIRKVAPEAEIQEHAVSLLALAAIHAEQRHLGEVDVGIELAQGQLGACDPLRTLRKSLQAATIALAIFLVVLAICCTWRATRYEALAENITQQKKDLFRQAMPGKRVPRGVLRRLQREHEQLAGLVGQAAGLPTRESALVSMRDALLALPEDMRFRLLEIVVHQDRVTLDSEVRRHGDADRLAGALRNHGFEVQPPHTEQVSSKTVSVRLVAKRTSREPGQENRHE